MEIGPYIPIIVEATKFAFGELGKWLELARQRVGKKMTNTVDSQAGKKTPELTLEDFSKLEVNLQALAAAINVNVAETKAYAINGLVEQLQVHHRNFTDLERAEAEYGALTPMHVKRGIERQANAIIEKSERLRGLLSQVYGRKIENV